MEIKVKVIPHARKAEIIKLADGSLRVKVVSPPEKNKANEELTEMLARYYSVAKSRVRIVRGDRSREKLIEIED